MKTFAASPSCRTSESSLSRGDRWAAAAAAAAAALALALGGCMRIYPDPELPDVEIEWLTEFACSEDGERVVMSLSAIDPATEIGPATVPCEDGGVRFADVARLRYRLAARLEDETGAVLGSHDEEIDLRDGLSEQIFVFFARASDRNFRVSWIFDMGASCASLNATTVQLEATRVGGGPTFYFDAPCSAPVYVDGIPLDGTYTFTAYALAMDGVVAVSPESAPAAIARGDITDVETLTLSPCGAACPQPGP
jgi:hypothetical protein